MLTVEELKQLLDRYPPTMPVRVAWGHGIFELRAHYLYQDVTQAIPGGVVMLDLGSNARVDIPAAGALSQELARLQAFDHSPAYDQDLPHERLSCRVCHRDDQVLVTDHRRWNVYGLHPCWIVFCDRCSVGARGHTRTEAIRHWMHA